MLHALARSALQFGLARVGLGFGEAGNFQAGVKAVSEWFPRKERAPATGIFNSGTAIGVILALIIVPMILRHYSWHEVFWITGAFGFVWLIFWLLLFEVPSRHKRLTMKELDYIRNGTGGNAIREESRDNVGIFRMVYFLAARVCKQFFLPFNPLPRRIYHAI